MPRRASPPPEWSRGSAGKAFPNLQQRLDLPNERPEVTAKNHATTSAWTTFRVLPGGAQRAYPFAVLSTRATAAAARHRIARASVCPARRDAKTILRENSALSVSPGRSGLNAIAVCARTAVKTAAPPPDCQRLGMLNGVVHRSSPPSRRSRVRALDYYQTCNHSNADTRVEGNIGADMRDQADAPEAIRPEVTHGAQRPDADTSPRARLSAGVEVDRPHFQSVRRVAGDQPKGVSSRGAGGRARPTGAGSSSTALKRRSPTDFVADVTRLFDTQ